MIINTNTVWTGKVSLGANEQIEIAAGATLTIAEGAEVTGGRFAVYGTLNVDGSASNKVVFHDASFSLKDSGGQQGTILVDNASIEGGDFGDLTDGHFDITNSVFKHVEEFYIFGGGVMKRPQRRPKK